MRSWQQKRLASASHSEDWLITYADMITLLLCFFVVFLIMTMTKKEHAQHETTEHVVLTAPPEQHFKVQQIRPEEVNAPEVKTANVPFRDIELTPFHKIEAEADVMPTEKPATPVDTPAVAMAPAQPGSEVVSMPAPEEKPVLQFSTPLPPTMVEANLLPSQAPAVVQPGGDRITTIEMNSAAFFASGSAVLSEAGKNILSRVVARLHDDAYNDYNVTVEGHTDDSPVASKQFPSNWELSTARASAVVQYFITQGIDPGKLRAAGYADTKPKAPNRDAHGKAIPENQAMNRRVVIKLEKIEKEAPL